MKKARKQLVIFEIKMDKEGAISVDVNFAPSLAKKDKIAEIPLEQQQLQLMAANLASKVMVSLQASMKQVEEEEAKAKELPNAPYA